MYISEEEKARRLAEIKRFCDANGIHASKTFDSYYFTMRGHRYRVSNHTVEASNRHAYDRAGRKRRELYHPDGREDGVTYIHASRYRIIRIYLDLKLGAKLDGRGRVVGYTYRGNGGGRRWPS